jgi:hypothetical protein
MKSAFTFLLLFAYALAFAQVPQSLSYQAVARDANGECLADQQISLQISILSDSTDGPVLYRERFEGNVQTNAVGHFEVKIGTGSPQTGAEHLNFSDIRWVNQRTFLKVEYAPGNTTSFQEVGTTELLTVPYAMAAGNGKRLNSNTLEEFFTLFGTNGSSNAVIGGVAGPDQAVNNGGVNVRNSDGAIRAALSSKPTDDGSFGSVEVLGPNGSLNAEMTSIGATRNFGFIRVFDDQSQRRIAIFSQDQWEGAGRMITYGPNETFNAQIAIRSTDCPNNGWFGVYDDAGVSKASIRVDCNGTGRVIADGANGGIKSFRMPHPNKPDKQIVYACIEGPEAAAYERGTVTLVNGEAEVTFSETFEIVANPETLTVMALPRSADSKGLAVIENSAQGFKIKELGGGTGNYQVYWEAKAVRKGWEDFEVVQDVEKEELGEALHDDHH